MVFQTKWTALALVARHLLKEAADRLQRPHVPLGAVVVLRPWACRHNGRKGIQERKVRHSLYRVPFGDCRPIGAGSEPGRSGPSSVPEPDRARAGLERASIVEHRWRTQEALRTTSDMIRPVDLLDLVPLSFRVS